MSPQKPTNFAAKFGAKFWCEIFGAKCWREIFGAKYFARNFCAKFLREILT
jgi:hypothetical protein